MFNDDSSMVPADDDGDVFPVESSYVHLGSVRHADASVHHPIDKRISATTRTFGALKTVFTLSICTPAVVSCPKIDSLIRREYEISCGPLKRNCNLQSLAMAETSGLHAAFATVRQTNAAHVSALDALERAFTAETAG